MAQGAGADIVLAPELYVSGYPAEDLVLRRAFQDAVRREVERLARVTASGAWIVVGVPWALEGQLYNAALAIGAGRVQAVVRKQRLPNYGVFDEVRVFQPGPPAAPVPIKGARVGLLVCEDMWMCRPAAAAAATGAELLVALNGSPFDAAQIADREAQARARVAETGLPLLYVNQVGGQDELVFDGTSFAMDASGAIVARAASWRPETAIVRVRGGPGAFRVEGTVHPLADPRQMTYAALVAGLRCYAMKNGFRRIVLGLSGGIDSALSAAVAVDAVGADRVRCVLLPSEYTSRESVGDAEECRRRLGARALSLPIHEPVRAFSALLADPFAGHAPDTTEENVQARVRAIVLMAMSNKFGDLLLSTGNKSEMSAGYATLYGDMSGGFSVLKDVYKTEVYALARWRNRHVPPGGLGPAGEVIPESVLTKAPTAELRPNQLDTDTLPPYDELDDILRALVDEERPLDEIVALGHARDTVARIEAMVYAAEYKRRQAPPGVRISRRNFGRDRRYPITNRFREGPDREPSWSRESEERTALLTETRHRPHP